MKIKYFIIYAGLALSIAGCKKDNSPTNNHPTNGGSTDTITKGGGISPSTTNYSITETFEDGAKTAYADANVALSTGSWDFNDALLGNLSSDVKDGNQCVRLRTGDIAMNFDINNVTQISIKHAKYGSDGSSNWELMISSDGGKTYKQLGNTINETSTTLVTDSFKVTVTGKVRFEIAKTGSNRVDLDDINFKGTGDPGITLTDPTTGPDTSASGSASAPRGVTVGTDAPPETGDNSNLLLGNPSGATNATAMMDNYLIDQGYYVESYNADRGEPNWVSWHLDANNITNATDRLNNFAGFNGLPQGWFQVQSNGYSGSGFDRGHNCPSADRTSSSDANSATFLMTNMIPQAPNNNESTWANLEDYIREQVVQGNEAYIIMGSYGTGGTGSKGAANSVDGGHVNVPSNVWKIAVIIPVGNGDISRITTNTRVIAVNTPNINTINSDWTQYIVTVQDIETATGLDIFSSLPAGVKASLEVKKDGGL
jgi:endonuclease G, mitochondrial